MNSQVVYASKKPCQLFSCKLVRAASSPVNGVRHRESLKSSRNKNTRAHRRLFDQRPGTECIHATISQKAPTVGCIICCGVLRKWNKIRAAPPCSMCCGRPRRSSVFSCCAGPCSTQADRELRGACTRRTQAGQETRSVRNLDKASGVINKPQTGLRRAAYWFLRPQSRSNFSSDVSPPGTWKASEHRVKGVARHTDQNSVLSAYQAKTCCAFF